MIRIVLAGRSERDWRTYRQEQWMAEVRRDPSAAGWPRSHHDVEEDAYRELIGTWTLEGHASSRTSALDRLARAGAIEVHAR